MYLAALSIILIAGCQKEILKQTQENTTQNGLTANSVTIQSTCSTPYQITLEDITSSNDTWTWTWSVQNPNPGNGSNGTYQNLSHWCINLGECATMDDVIGGSMSTDGTTWTDFTPAYEQDNSMYNTCGLNTGNVLKFAEGTTGSDKTYYRLVVNKNFDVNLNGSAFYKGGVNTGCGTTCFPGIGCPIVETGCSYSQGYWFAAPAVVWDGSVTLGNQTYSQTEGKNIWNSSNKGGIGIAKKAYLQAAAIKLSGSSVPANSPVLQYVSTIDAFLASLPKLNANNVKNYNTSANANNASVAADSISSWITRNHCE